MVHANSFVIRDSKDRQHPHHPIIFNRHAMNNDKPGQSKRCLLGT
jgi:hypothetical protein